MKQITFLLSSIVIISQSIQIYPTHSTLNYQWENQIWQDCTNKAKVVPSNCAHNEQVWNECYTIPENGLCLINNFTIDTTKTNYLLGLTFQNIQSEQTIQVIINDLEPYSIILNSSKNNVIQKIELSNPSASLGIKILGTNAQLSNLLITTECDYTTIDCSECQEGEFLYNYICTSDSCFDQLSQVTSQMMVSSMGELDAENNYQLSVIFNVPIGDCLVPKIYLTKSLTDTTIISVLESNQLTVDNSKTLKFFLTFDQVKTCQAIDTDTRIVYQCYVGIAITYSKVTQYLLILIGQISVDKQTSSTSSHTQVIDVPNDDTEVVGPIIVVSEIKVNAEQNTVIATQEVTDPQFQDSTLEFESATATQNGKDYEMNLLSQSIDKGQANYTLNSTNQQFDTSKEFNLTVESTITNVGRRLLASTINRNTMQASYSANNLFIFKGDNIIDNKPLEIPLGGGYVALIAISMLIVTIFLMILTTYLLDKFGNQNLDEPQIQQQLPEQNVGNLVNAENAGNAEKKQIEQVQN